MRRLEERWRRRQEPQPESRTVKFQEAARLFHTTGVVWALIYPAECAPLLSSTTARGFKVPGTPDGVGEQQCLIDLDGNASIIEVIHLEVGRRATTRVVSPSPPVPTRTRFEVQPIDAGCVITLACEMDLPAGWVIRSDGETDWRRGATEYLERLRQILEDEAGSPSSRT